MQSGHFRQWLAEQGCSIRQGDAGAGSSAAEVRRGERHALLETYGPEELLDERMVSRTVDALGLKRSDLPGRWEHFPHGADIGVRGIGPTLEAAFAQAARAMTGAAVDPDTLRPEVQVNVLCAGENAEDLLYSWLNALVYEMAVRRMLFGRFDVEIENGCLRGVAWGEPVSQSRHEPAVEVKGATMTALKVRRESGEWVAECVIDV